MRTIRSLVLGLIVVALSRMRNIVLMMWSLTLTLLRVCRCLEVPGMGTGLAIRLDICICVWWKFVTLLSRVGRAIARVSL